MRLLAGAGEQLLLEQRSDDWDEAKSGRNAQGLECADLSDVAAPTQTAKFFGQRMTFAMRSAKVAT